MVDKDMQEREKASQKAIRLFLRGTVPTLLKARPIKTVQPPPPIALTRDEQDAIAERMAEFHEHDR
jgi:hypothetical protein